jgi:hypothetical protein
MRYMLLITSDPEVRARMSPEEGQKMITEYAALTRALQDSGEWIAGEPLAGTETATTVRLQGAEPVASDGPFVETKEYICGFYLLDCADLDRAMHIAGQVPGLVMGSVEVRPALVMP